MIEGLPSGPVTPRASTILWVSRKGTRSGVSSVFPYIASRVAMSLGHVRAHLFKETIEVDVYNVPGMRIHEDVFKMTITETRTVVNRLGLGKDDDCSTQG